MGVKLDDWSKKHASGHGTWKYLIATGDVKRRHETRSKVFNRIEQLAGQLGIRRSFEKVCANLGREIYRSEELNHPVDASGEIMDSGEVELDGPVKNAMEMINKLDGSERVQQVFVRHAFRF